MPELPRDLWLESHGDGILIENVWTGRFVTTTPQGLATALSSGELGSTDKPGAEVLRAVDRALREWSCAPTHDPLQRLELCRQNCLERLRPKPEIRRDLLAVFRTAQALLGEPEVRAFEFFPGLLEAVWRRPSLEYDFGQLPCLPETTQRRLALAKERLNEDSRGLILGDDDLMGLCWGLMYPGPCDVFELDQRLLDFYQGLDLPPTLRFHRRDLTRGLPEEFHGRYDFIFTDPMYGKSGMDMFLLCCSQGLSPAREARLFLSTRPDLIEDGERLEERLQEVGLRIEQIHRNFSRYKLPEKTRRMALESLRTCGLPRYLLRGLLKVPYYYSDHLEVSRIL